MSDNVSTKQRIFEAIAESKTISRIRLAEKYQLRLATVTEVTRQLLNAKLIMEAGEEFSTGGRKPVLLKVNPDAFHTLGLSLGRDRLNCGLFNSAMEPKYEISLPTDSTLKGDELLQLLRQTIDMAIKKAGIPMDTVAGIGIGLPARVDIEAGIYNGAIYYPHLKGVKVKQALEAAYHIPVIVDHDVVLMTIAEYYLAEAGVPDNLGVLFIGRGIGCRFIINGEIYRGVSNRASEFGHLSLQSDGPECYCGNRGCFERLANTEAIEREYGGDKNLDEIVKLAAAGDERAIAVFRRITGYIAAAAANILNIKDVEMLIINGDIVIAKEVINEELHRQLREQHLQNRSMDPEKVFFSGIGKKVGTLGPALMAADRNFLRHGINIFPKRKLA